MVLPRAFALLRLLANARGGMSLSEIATQLDVPKSSLSSTLKALVDQRVLSRERTLYTLGPEAYSLASAIMGGRTIAQITRPFLHKALEACGETVLLAMLDADGDHFSYVEIAESSNPVRYSVPIGTRRPLYATACGKLFLSVRGEAERRAYYARTALEKISDATETDPEALEAQCAAIREAGASITFGEFSADAVGFAAPINGSGGALVAALVIAAPISRGRRERDRFAALATETAEQISTILGGARDDGDGDAAP